MDRHGRPKTGYVFSGTRDRPDPFMVDTVLALVDAALEYFRSDDAVRQYAKYLLSGAESGKTLVVICMAANLWRMCMKLPDEDLLNPEKREEAQWTFMKYINGETGAPPNFDHCKACGAARSLPSEEGPL